MTNSFSKDYYINNRQTLTSSLGANKLCVIAGNGLIQQSADNNYDFVQDSNFYYLTGLTEPSCFLLLDPLNKREYFCYKPKSKIEILFDGDYNFDEISNVSGIANYLTFNEAFDYLKKYSSGQIFYNINKKYSGLYSNPHNQYIAKRIRLRSQKLIDIYDILSDLLCIKQQQEINKIRSAVSYTKQAINVVKDNLHNYKNESQALAAINTYFAAKNIRHAYPPMVAAGKSATTAHYGHNLNNIYKNDYLLLDIGAKIDYYCADISRTFYNGSDPFKLALITQMIKIQKQLISMVKPGVTFKELQAQAGKLISTLLINNKLMDDSKMLTSYFPYAIGHFLGIDVHDVGDYSKPLQKNMIITIEPGIHIPQKNIGIRIEDDILVTFDSAEVL